VRFVIDRSGGPQQRCEDLLDGVFRRSRIGQQHRGIAVQTCAELVV
jgi:hypothetical protein